LGLDPHLLDNLSAENMSLVTDSLLPV
jgi:hypothetical protein